MQFGSHAALGQSNQVAVPPLFNRRLDAIRYALRYVASLEIVLLSGACSASRIMIRANTPISRQRFKRLYSVFGGPYATGALHQRRRGAARSCPETSTGRRIGPTARNVMHPIAIDENNPAQYTKVIHASTSSALWKVRPQLLHLRLSQPIQIAHDILQQLGIVNHGNATSSTR
ncbi:MAG: hypothetical protein ACI9C3_001306 [Yoonia sp.]|jgi:hypothetical protein